MGRAIVNKVTYSAEIWVCDDNGDCALIRKEFDFTDVINEDMLKKANSIIDEAKAQVLLSIPSMRKICDENGAISAFLGTKRIEDIL
jgi:hypothetical protein